MHKGLPAKLEVTFFLSFFLANAFKALYIVQMRENGSDFNARCTSLSLMSYFLEKRLGKFKNGEFTVRQCCTVTPSKKTINIVVGNFVQDC